MLETKISDWMRIPRVLQERFYEHTEEEAERIKATLKVYRGKLSALRTYLRFADIPENADWRKWRVGFVDGTKPAELYNRHGRRFAPFAAGYMIWQEGRIAEENFYSDKFASEQVGSPSKQYKIMSLLLTRMERRAALDCLKRDVDLLIVDGGFFSFRVKCEMILAETVKDYGFDKGIDLVDDIKRDTIKIIQSNKAIAIMKTVVTSAIDGWIAWMSGNEEFCLNDNDKNILACIMPPRKWFSYEWLLGSNSFSYFSHHVRRRLSDVLSRQEKPLNPKSPVLLEWARNEHNRIVQRNLRCPATMIETQRYFIRSSPDTPPCCLETPVDMPRFIFKDILSYLYHNASPVTGLPLPFDHMDETISLPKGFSKEFVEEIEAILLADETVDKNLVFNWFLPFNPQKEI